MEYQGKSYFLGNTLPDLHQQGAGRQVTGRAQAGTTALFYIPFFPKGEDFSFFPNLKSPRILLRN
jgi:hypothetical protein